MATWVICSNGEKNNGLKNVLHLIAMERAASPLQDYDEGLEGPWTLRTLLNNQY